MGGLYFSIDSTNPTEYFGGTWELFYPGKTIVGVNENDTDFATVNKTGGAKTITLIAAQMPQHDHELQYVTDTVNAGSDIDAPLSRGSSGSTEQVFQSNTVGSGGAHNNLMPFVTYYIWRRIA